MKDYNKLLNKPFREEVTVKISQEVKVDFPNANKKEINHFVNNIYVYCILKAHNIAEQDIADQLVYLNSQYLDEMQEDGKIEGSKINCNNIDYLVKLNDKYLKIIKEKM